VKNAREIIGWRKEDGYSLASSYLSMFEEGRNSIVQQSEGRFHRLFMYPEACQKALQWCTPILALDDCHLKAAYGGVLLLIAASDSLRNILLLAFVVVSVENGDNWRWFLGQFNNYGVGLWNGILTVILDRDKGNCKAGHLQSDSRECSIKNRSHDQLFIVDQYPV
jgi:hypothetical protein